MATQHPREARDIAESGEKWTWYMCKTNIGARGGDNDQGKRNDGKKDRIREEKRQECGVLIRKAHGEEDAG